MYNLTTYPHLVGLFETLNVETEPSDMSFALSVDGGNLEWGSRGLGAIFAQRSNLLRPSFWRMIYDVVRFGKACLEVCVCRADKTQRPCCSYCCCCYLSVQILLTTLRQLKAWSDAI